MISFLARSALCIGAVAAVAGGVGTGRLAASIDGDVRRAVDGAGRACLASSECLRVGAAALSAAAAPASSPGQTKPRAAPPGRDEAGPPRKGGSPLSCCR